VAFVVAAATLPVTTSSQAHDMDMDVEMGVGRVHLASSCSPAAQRQIDLGVGFLYSFMYDEARRSFQRAAWLSPVRPGRGCRTSRSEPDGTASYQFGDVGRADLWRRQVQNPFGL
jgi:hypothetical protein